MRRLILLLVIVACVGAGSGSVLPFFWRPSGPAIRVAEQFRFTSQPIGKTILAKIPVANAGREVLLLESMKTSCGCMIVELPGGKGSAKAGEIRLLPGETRDLELRIVMRGTPRQLMRERLSFRTNDPTRPLVEIEVILELEGQVFCVPSEVNLGDVAGGQTITRQVDLWPTAKVLQHST